MFLATALLIGLILLGNYVDRPDHKPQFYGDFRGGYAKGVDLQAAGLTQHDCEAGLRGPYASPTTWPAIQAKGIYLSGCRRGAKGKQIGDYVHRVDFLINSG